MATYIKRNNRVTARVRMKGVSRSRTFATRTEARTWATQIEADINSRSLGMAPKHITVGDIITRYMREVTVGKRGSKSELVRLGRILRTDLANINAADLRAVHVTEWRDNRLKEVQAPSVAREMTTISSIFNHAMKEWGLLDDNPVRKISRPKANKARSRRPTDDEIRRICLWCNYDSGVKPVEVRQRTALAFLFAIETAMRAGEMCALKWDDIQLQRRVAHLEMTKNGHSRDVPLSKHALTLLEQLKTADLKTVFEMSPDVLSTMFRRATRMCEIHDLHFHDSRREALTRMSKKVNVMDLAKISGHRDVKILLNTYYAPDASNLADLLD